jgi:hypothetical protein
VCGIINGGLGLQLAGNSTGGIIGYGVVAGVIAALYLVLVVFKRNGGDKIDGGRRRGLTRKPEGE